MREVATAGGAGCPLPSLVRVSGLAPARVRACCKMRPVRLLGDVAFAEPAFERLGAIDQCDHSPMLRPGLAASA